MKLRSTWISVPAAAAGLVAAALVAADFNEGAAGSVTAAAPAPARTPEEPTGHRSPGKLRPPVEVSLLQASQLEAGVPASLILQVRSTAGVEGVELDVDGDEGLAVMSTSREVPGTGGTRYQTDGEAARFEISAVPLSGGTRQLSGLLRFTVNGVAQAAPFRVSVDVGGPLTAPAARSQKPEREPVRDTTGEIIDSMQAEVTVR